VKKFLLVIGIIALSGILIFIFYPFETIELIINDQRIDLTDPVIMEEDELFAPAEIIFEELGALTRWDRNSKVFSGQLGNFRVFLPADSKEVMIAGETVTWDSPVKMINDTVYVPVKPAAEAMGAFVEFDEEAGEVLISTPQDFDPDQKEDQEGPLLHVSYPPDYQIDYYANSLFVFGTTQSYSQIDVTVNGKPADMLNRKTGNFLAMVDIPRGEEHPVTVEASDGVETTTIERKVLYPEGLQTMPEEPLEIHSTHLVPGQDQLLNPGDTLKIAARGSPGARAHYRIGEGTYVEMEEFQYPTGPPGNGGIYTATYTVKQLDAPAYGVSDTMPITVILEKGEEQVSRELPGKVAFSSAVPYKVLEVIEQSELKFGGWFWIIREDSYQLYAQTRGGSGYPTDVASYLTEGTRFEAVGASGDYYRVKLEESETYLLNKEAVKELVDIDSLEPVLSEIELSETVDKISLRLKADERFPFLIDSGTDQLTVKMYGIEQESDILMPDSPDSVKDLSLEPIAGEPNALEATLELGFNLTGYTSSWEDRELVIDLSKPPEVNANNPLQGKTIVIDPGHGGEDPGAPGPGDLHEKEVVLKMSLYLRDLLLEEGAEVIMTRTEDVDVDLYDRPKAEHIEDTDFFISVHANAHAHGAEALDTHGIMTLYNYDHNEELANIMLDKVAEEMDLPAMYTWRRNIALTRHTQFPFVLVEAGYMMHPEDNWYIIHPRGQQRFARAMKEGIKEYFLSFE